MYTILCWPKCKDSLRIIVNRGGTIPQLSDNCKIEGLEFVIVIIILLGNAIAPMHDFCSIVFHNKHRV